jgi:predicted dehydrogenase
MNRSTSRRDFLKTMAAAGAATVGTTMLGRAAGAQTTTLPTELPNARLRMAFIGTGGKGAVDIAELARLGVDCACYCDVDTRQFKEVAHHFPNAKPFQDYRAMFDKMHKEFDAVTVSIPDHGHYPATVLAMNHEKSVYTQKPLTHTVWEARQLAEKYKTYKAATQMGNQGHANEGCRVTYEWVRQGAIGDIKEVHTFTDRPIWPQGIDRPPGSDPVPAALDWNMWLGDAPRRPFKHGIYHAFNWRGWFDFGCGALGDMACHSLTAMFMALEPGYPTTIEPVEVNGLHPETYPKSSIIKWTFPANDWRPGFAAYWYDGGKIPARPSELEADRKLPDMGNIYIGTKGTMLVSGGSSDSPRIIPETKLKEIGKPRRMLERSPGHYEEFVQAALGKKPLDFPKSNFGFAAPMTETILLGNIAMRMGRSITWDGPNLRITNLPDANKLLTKEYPEGWRF